VSTSRYKGFNILAKPYPLHEPRCWTADLEIRRSGRSQPFAIGGRYESEDEAQNECAGMGRRIIDGGVPGWSVDHLRVPPPARRSFADVWRGESMRVFLCAGFLILALGVYAFLRLARD
jgi:hypothetical protein